MEWTKEIQEHHLKSLNESLKLVDDFPGMIAIVGSSANEKYPMGDDIDVALVGLSAKDGMMYSWSLARKVMSEQQKNISLFEKGVSIDDLHYPLLIEASQRLDDPFVALEQKLIIPGYCSAAIKLGYLPFPIGSKRSETDYLNSYMQHGNTQYRTRIDFLVEYCFENLKLDETIRNWKNAMNTINRNFVEIG